MLVANPGQTPYSLISKKPCHNKPARNNAAVGSSIKYTPSSSNTITPSSSAVVSKTMTAVTEVPSSHEQNALKTLSVRISRETDLLKHTVQKALISKIPSHFSSVLTLYTVPPTSTHRFPERTESLSVDSLKTEMCHFKPIRTVPTTPTKRSKAVIIKIPKAKMALNCEQDRDEGETTKPSANSSAAAIVLASPRVSAFSYVALIDKIPAITKLNQQHKTKSKAACLSGKINERNPGLNKSYSQPRVLVKHIVSMSSDAKVKKELVPPIPVTHRTRRSTKASTASSVELQNSQAPANANMRTTRKRQQTLKNEEMVPNKNAKVTKDCSKPTKSGKKRAASTERRTNRRTPPVTRSRLKQNIINTKQYQNK